MAFWPSREESERLKHIAHVLVDHGLGKVLVRLGLRTKVPFYKRIEAREHDEPNITPQLVLKIFEEVNGSFIKLGQLLSMRPDLIPTDYCVELAKLQDSVTPFPGKQAKEIVEKELGKPIRSLFKKFDETPIAAASMGQVHRAELKDGTQVAVKVLRPGIERVLKIDIKLLYRLARVVRRKYKTSMVNPIEIVREFERYTQKETNYLQEAHNIDLFHKNFEKSDVIVIPKVYWKYTTSKVLTMEYIPGRRLTDIATLSKERKKEIINTIINAQFEQVFIHGFFHADPHPGNFIIKKDGRIALLDFGIVGRLDYELRDDVTDFFVCLINQDVEGMIDVALKLGAAADGIDINKVKMDIYDRLSAYYGTSLNKIQMSKALHDIIMLLKQNNLRVAPNFVLLAKATVTTESLAYTLDPSLNFVNVARPFVKRLAKERLKPQHIAERARRKVEAMFNFAESIPRKTTDFLADLHDTSRDLRRIDKDLNTLAVEMDRSSNRVTLGFLAGTLMIASTILLPFQRPSGMGIPPLSLTGYLLALFVLLVIFISIIREKKI